MTSSLNKELIEDIVVIPSEINGYPVTAIENEAFYNSCITNVILPDTIEIINNNAFYRCTALKEITFSDGLKYIGTEAFYSDLKTAESKTVILPKTVDIIGVITEPKGEIDSTGIGGYTKS